METVERMRIRHNVIWSHLDEKRRRLWVASEAKAHGRGGLKLVNEVSGISRGVIITGMKELSGGSPLAEGRIGLNRQGRPLISHEVIVNLIESTSTRTGLKVRATLDPNQYPKGIKMPDAEMKALCCHPESFHGE